MMSEKFSDLVSGHCSVNPFSDAHRYKATGGIVNPDGHVSVERTCKYCAHTMTTDHPPK